MYQIPIFKAERDAGLVEKIRASASVAFASALTLSDKVLMGKNYEDKLRKFALGFAGSKSKASIEDFDLHYLKTILVSTGWNKNDDVFERFETWAARRTPEDKPVNYEHNCSDIIGHMIGCYVIGENSELVTDESVVDDLPSKFHIVVGAVLYKYWDKPDLQERMDNVLREIAQGGWFVSMEALFKGFDYAVVANDGTARIIARNEETAFLTKHLRAYGGTGAYEDMKVGRLLRNIVFSGKGLVRKPANPDSVILTQANDFRGTLGKLSEFLRAKLESGYSEVASLSSDVTPKERRDNMATENETLQKQLAALQADNEKLQKQLADTNSKQLEAQVKAAEDAKAKSDEALKTANEKIVALEKNAATIADEVKALKATIEKSETAHKAVSDELNTIKEKVKTAARIAAVKTALKVNESDAEAVKAAEELATTLTNLSDEGFAAHLKAISKFTPAQLPPKGTPAKDPPKATNKPAPMSGKGSETEDPAEGAADSKTLDDAEPDAEAALATSEAAGAQVQAVRKSIASYFGCEPDEENAEE